MFRLNEHSSMNFRDIPQFPQAHWGARFDWDEGLEDRVRNLLIAEQVIKGTVSTHHD